MSSRRRRYEERPLSANVPIPAAAVYEPFDSVGTEPTEVDGLREVLNGVPSRTVHIADLVSLLSVAEEGRHRFWALLEQSYPVARPTATIPHPLGVLPEVPSPKPEPQRAEFKPRRKLRDYVFSGEWNRKKLEAGHRFTVAHDAWEATERARRREEVRLEEHKAREVIRARMQENLDKAIGAWEQARDRWVAAQEADLARLRTLREGYKAGQPEAVREFAQVVLRRSPRPEKFPRDCVCAYDRESRLLVVDLQLPDFDQITIVHETRRDFKLAVVSKRDHEKARKRAIYAMAVRTLWEIADADDVGVVESIVCNGWVEFFDRSTGNLRREFILTVQASREELRSWTITRVDPEAAFRSLKGTAAPKLDAYVPIVPAINVNRNDQRIIDNREVVDHLDKGENLAAMEWDDFEHLVRELFEREWAQRGAEVKVTQASHDRGVDALVFDPDPLTGGTFVIQAKRYTRVVDVSAVRDLYGTVVNEGANRGILVTTSSYGHDAYEFAKGKPLTLLTGNHLLGLLERHGYKFRIDLEEARRLRD